MPSPERMESSAGAAEKLVMVIDDDPMQLKQIGDFLRRQGIRCVLEGNGFSAIQTIKSTVPDIILLDVRMPGLDGIQTAQVVQRMAKNTKIILMSGHADMLTAAAEAGLEVFATVDKPLPLRTLSRFIHEAFAQP